MKTLILFALSLILLSNVMYAGNANNLPGTGIDSVTPVSAGLKSLLVLEEPYVNDIPFDTEVVSMTCCYIIADLKGEEESVDDIPFDTERIAATYLYNISTIHPQDEAYVNDIPFNTKRIANNYLRNNTGLATVR